MSGPKHSKPPTEPASPRFDVTITGDRIRLLDDDGQDAAGLYLPWMSRQDQFEIAPRFDALIKG